MDFYRRKVNFSLILFLLYGSVVALFPQPHKDLDIGSFQYSASETMTLDYLHWPREWRLFGYIRSNNLSMLRTFGVIIGQELSWTDSTGKSHSVQVAQAQGDKFGNPAAVLVPVSDEFQQFYRQPYPTEIINGQDLTCKTAPSAVIQPDLPADEVIHNRLQVWPKYKGGLQLDRWIYAFVSRRNFIFQEFVLRNVSNEVRRGVYLAIAGQTSADEKSPGDIWGNYRLGPQAGDSLRMWYSWDSDDKSDPGDNKGNPQPEWGNFQEPQYFGMVVVHADRGSEDESDDPRQPIKAGWAGGENFPALKNATQETMYDFISQPWDKRYKFPYSQFVDSSGTPRTNEMYRVLRKDFAEDEFDSRTEPQKIALLSFGPYTLQPGEDVQVVIALTGGVISPKLAIAAGRAYNNGTAGRQATGVVPLPYDVFDSQDGQIAQRGDILTELQKNAILALSRDSLFKNASRAVKCWQNGNVREGVGSFHVPLAPAAPSVNHSDGLDEINLSWERVDDAREYRIYREYKRPPYVMGPTDTLFFYDPKNHIPFVETTEIAFTDRNVIRGEDYYYSIVSVNEAGLESSKWLNWTGDDP